MSMTIILENIKFEVKIFLPFVNFAYIFQLL